MLSIVVDLRQTLSSFTLPSRSLSESPDPPVSQPPSHVAAPNVRRLKRLTESELADLVAAYRAGATVYDLADMFGIHRVTVAKHLRAAGVRLRLDGLTPEQVDQAEALYRSGQSLARIGDQLGVAARTVRSQLLARGVRMRDTHARER